MIEKNEINIHDMKINFIHVTSSANNCDGIKKLGICDLKDTYLQENSELRDFLTENGVIINIQNQNLTYNGTTYDISLKNSSFERNSIKYKGFMVGRRFYDDQMICGFWHEKGWEKYDGDVQKRPELLKNLDDLLETKLSDKWTNSHQAYMVKAQVDYHDIIESENCSVNCLKLSLLERAYKISQGDYSEETLILKRGVSVPPDSVIEINELKNL